MKKQLLITGDTNDADFTSQITDITDEEVILFLPIVLAIKSFKPYKGKGRSSHKYTHSNNFPHPDGEYSYRPDLGEKSAKELYGHIVGFDKFLEYFCPSDIHSIEEIKVITTVHNLL